MYLWHPAANNEQGRSTNVPPCSTLAVSYLRNVQHTQFLVIWLSVRENSHVDMSKNSIISNMIRRNWLSMRLSRGWCSWTRYCNTNNNNNIRKPSTRRQLEWLYSKRRNLIGAQTLTVCQAASAPDVSCKHSSISFCEQHTWSALTPTTYHGRPEVATARKNRPMCTTSAQQASAIHKACEYTLFLQQLAKAFDMVLIVTVGEGQFCVDYKNERIRLVCDVHGWRGHHGPVFCSRTQ